MLLNFITAILKLRYSLFLIIVSVFADDSIPPWRLPVLPSSLPDRLGNLTQDKLIPRHLWIAVRNVEDELNYQMSGLFERNSNWEVHVVGNNEKDKFMNEVNNKYLSDLGIGYNHFCMSFDQYYSKITCL
jgi:hypothetical protein